MGKMTTRDSLDHYRELPVEVEQAMIIAKLEELGLIEDTGEVVDDFEELKTRWLSESDHSGIVWWPN